MNKARFVRISLILAVILMFFLTACVATDKNSAGPEKTDFALDTFVTLTLYEGGDEETLDAAMALIKDYEKIFSARDESSELYKLNNRKKFYDSNTVKVSSELAHVIETGLKFGSLSNGAFDITIFPVSSLWDFSSDEGKLPEAEALAEAAEKVDYKKVHVDGDSVSFDNYDIQLDLGAIAKGYIADKVKEYLADNGVSSGIINLGGNILCIGSKPDGSPFGIGIQDPQKETGEAAERLELSDVSAVTTGSYQRCFVLDGKLYHHVLNPKTGYPYDNGLSSVTIVYPVSEVADALSTVCFCLGETEGRKFLDAWTDAEGYFY